MIKQLNESLNLIIQVLTASEEARNDDKELNIRAWAAQGFVLTPEQQQAYRRCYSTETYRRNRQRLQESGRFLPTRAVRRRRKKLAKETRDYFALNKAGQKPIGWDCDSKPGTAIPIYE